MNDLEEFYDNNRSEIWRALSSEQSILFPFLDLLIEYNKYPRVTYLIEHIIDGTARFVAQVRHADLFSLAELEKKMIIINSTKPLFYLP